MAAAAMIGRIGASGWRLAAVVGLAVAVLISLRVSDLGGMEPRADQASVMVWVQELIDAERWWPRERPGEPLVERLIGDEKSVANIILRRVYVVQDHIFVGLSLAWFWVMGLVLGAGVSAQITASIIAGSLALALFALAPVLSRGALRDAVPVPETAFALMVLGLGATSSFLHLFSAAGIHDVGLLGLAVGLIGTQAWISRLPPDTVVVTLRAAWPGLLWALLAQGVAYYSHYTTVFLLPAATALAILTLPGWQFQARLKLLAYYGAGVVVLFAPALVLIVAGGLVIHTEQDQDFLTRLYWVFSQGGNAPADFWRRAVGWWQAHAGILSPGLVGLGLFGIIGMASRDGLRLPLYLLASHWTVSIVMSGFTQYDRTAAYSTPLFLMGAAWALVWGICHARRAWRREANRLIGGALLPLVLAAVLVLHYQREAPRLADYHKVEIWAMYTRSDGQFLDAVAEIEALVPEASVVIPWDYKISHLFRALSSRARADLTVIRPVQSLRRELAAGTLKSYLKRRRIDLSEAGRAYVLAPRNLAGEAGDLTEVFGQQGFGWPAPVSVAPLLGLGPWQAGGRVDELTLYRVH